jgi:hypothetical protein
LILRNAEQRADQSGNRSTNDPLFGPEARSHCETHGEWYRNHRHDQPGSEITQNIELEIPLLQILIPRIKRIEKQFDPVANRVSWSLRIGFVVHILFRNRHVFFRRAAQKKLPSGVRFQLAKSQVNALWALLHRGRFVEPHAGKVWFRFEGFAQGNPKNCGRQMHNEAGDAHSRRANSLNRRTRSPHA